MLLIAEGDSACSVPEEQIQDMRVGVVSATADIAEINAILARLRACFSGTVAFLSKPVTSQQLALFLNEQEVPLNLRHPIVLTDILRREFLRRRYGRYLPGAGEPGTLPGYPEIFSHLQKGLEGVCAYLLTGNAEDRIFAQRDVRQLRMLRDQLFVATATIRAVLGDGGRYSQEVLAQIHNVAGAFEVLLQELDRWKVCDHLQTARRKAPDTQQILILVDQVKTLLPRLSLSAQQVEAMPFAGFFDILKQCFPVDKVHLMTDGFDSIQGRRITAHALTVYYEVISILVNNALVAGSNRVTVTLAFDEEKKSFSILVSDVGKPMPRGFELCAHQRLEQHDQGRRRSSGRGLTDFCVFARDFAKTTPNFHQRPIPGGQAVKTFSVDFPVCFVDGEVA